jgi:hypothetical protein
MHFNGSRRGARRPRLLFSAAWLCVAGLCAAPVRAADSPAEPAPSAQQLLDDTVAQLPRDPLKVNGDLIVRKWRGVVVQQLRFEMALDWGRQPSVARYLIRNNFGASLEQLTVTRTADGATRFAYAAGDSLAPAKTPDLFQPIQGSDMSWMDLALSFLWWKGGRVTGSEEILGRKCYVLEVPAPAPQGAKPATALQYASVRLWIDKELHMLLQAEGLDAQQQVLRRLWIKGFKKMNDRWMIKVMEVQQLSTDHRTKVLIREIDSEPVPDEGSK